MLWPCSYHGADVSSLRGHACAAASALRDIRATCHKYCTPSAYCNRRAKTHHATRISICPLPLSASRLSNSKKSGTGTHCIASRGGGFCLGPTQYLLFFKPDELELELLGLNGLP